MLSVMSGYARRANPTYVLTQIGGQSLRFWPPYDSIHRVRMCADDSPLAGGDCMDAGGRATQDAQAEGLG